MMVGCSLSSASFHPCQRLSNIFFLLRVIDAPYYCAGCTVMRFMICLPTRFDQSGSRLRLAAGLQYQTPIATNPLFVSRLGEVSSSTRFVPAQARAVGTMTRMIMKARSSPTVAVKLKHLVIALIDDGLWLDREHS